MKKLMIVSMISLITGFLSCNKEVDKKTPAINNLKLNGIEYSGCFDGNYENSEKSIQSFTDTLFYTIEQDTLTLSAILSYNCCGLLSDSVVIDNNEVNIFIADTCLGECLCNCVCDFEFNYKFYDFWQKNISFKVYLKGLNENEYELWRETEFINKND